MSGCMRIEIRVLRMELATVIARNYALQYSILNTQYSEPEVRHG